MKVLVLGGSGMLGHQLFAFLSRQRSIHVRATLRRPLAFYKSAGLFTEEEVYDCIDANRWTQVKFVIQNFEPQAVINAIGIIKQGREGALVFPSLRTNALFPHLLADYCEKKGIQFVHISTDCVFSGKKGNYKDDDSSDATDVYGKTKYCGEVVNGLTLRTSMIGRELFHKRGLLEWFLKQKGVVKGFENAIFSGLTTLELSRVIEMLITRHPEARGVYNVSSEPISKFALLHLIKKELNLLVQIKGVLKPYCDRSLDSTKFRREFDYKPPSWEKMLKDVDFYDFGQQSNFGHGWNRVYGKCFDSSSPEW